MLAALRLGLTEPTEVCCFQCLGFHEFNLSNKVDIGVAGCRDFDVTDFQTEVHFTLSQSKSQGHLAQKL